MDNKVIKLFVFFMIIQVSCKNNDTQSEEKKNDAASMSLSVNEPTNKDSVNTTVTSNVSLEELTKQVNMWFMEQNKPFIELSDSITAKLELEEEQEWDGAIPEYNSHRKRILELASRSINSSNLFTQAYKNKLNALVVDKKQENVILNLPTLLLKDESAFQLSGFFFDQVFDLNKRQADLNTQYKEYARTLNLSKHKVASNSKLALCSAAFNMPAEGRNVILVYVEENNQWKVDDIFFESDLFE